MRPGADQFRACSRLEAGQGGAALREVYDDDVQRSPGFAHSLRPRPPPGLQPLFAIGGPRSCPSLGAPLVEDDAHVGDLLEGAPKALVQKRVGPGDHDDGSHAGEVLERDLLGTPGAQAMARSPVLERRDDSHQDAAPGADDVHGGRGNRSKVHAPPQRPRTPGIAWGWRGSSP